MNTTEQALWKHNLEKKYYNHSRKLISKTTVTLIYRIIKDRTISKFTSQHPIIPLPNRSGLGTSSTRVCNINHSETLNIPLYTLTYAFF